MSVSEQQFISKLSKTQNVKMMEMSNEEEVNVMKVRNTACDLLLENRVNSKTASSDPKMKQIENRLFVAEPLKRDNKKRETVSAKRLGNPRRRDILKRPMKEVVEENGGPGVFNFDNRLHWQLKRDEWTWDPIPQFYNGKNVLDFYHENVEQDMEELEREERALLIKEIEMEPEMERLAILGQLSKEDSLLHRYIERKMYFARVEGQKKRKLRNARPEMGRSQKKIPLSQLKESMQELGIDTDKVEDTVVDEATKRNMSIDRRRRGRSRTRESATSALKVATGRDLQAIARTQSRSRSRAEKADPNYRARSKSRARTPSKGISTMRASAKADDMMKRAMRSMNRKGMIHESDRRIDTKKPVLYLFADLNILSFSSAVRFMICECVFVSGPFVQRKAKTLLRKIDVILFGLIQRVETIASLIIVGLLNSPFLSNREQFQLYR